MRIVIVVAIYHCLLSICIAENPTEKSVKIGFRAERGSVNGKLACIADPESKLALVSFLRNKSIEKEIDLPQQKLAILIDLLAKSKGSLENPIYTQTFGRSGYTIKSLQEDAPFFKELGRATVFEMAEYNRQMVDSVFTDSEINRLRQIVYQVELFRVGPCEALNAGFLGKRLGIENYQRRAIQIRSDSVDLHLAASSKAVLKRAYLEFGQLLSLDKAAELEELLGDPFFFRDDTFSYNYYLKIPSPESLLASVAMVCNRSVAEELRVTEQERISIEQHLRGQRGQLEFVRVDARSNGRKRSKDELIAAQEIAREQNEAFIDDILDPKQKDRLRQLVYQVEIARLGIAEALTKGFLGKKLLIETSLLSGVCKKSETIFANAFAELNQLQLQARNEVFRELSPLQRQEVDQVLGKPFLFRDQILD